MWQNEEAITIAQQTNISATQILIALNHTVPPLGVRIVRGKDEITFKKY